MIEAINAFINIVKFSSPVSARHESTAALVEAKTICSRGRDSRPMCGGL